MSNLLIDLFGLSEETVDRDVRGATSPFRKEITPDGKSYTYDINARKGGHISKDYNYYHILSYQWYTRDIARLYSTDYYNKLEIGEATVTGKGNKKGFMDTITSAVTDKLDGIKNTVEDTVNQVVDGVDNLLNKKKKDPPAQPDYTQFIEFIHTFPKAKVYEFKPRDGLATTIGAISEGIKMIDSIVDTMGNKIDDGVIKEIRGAVKTFVQDTFSKDGNTNYNDPKFRTYGFPNGMYKNIISGYYTGYYEIPVLSYDGFLNSRGSEGWKQQGLMERQLGMASGIVKNITDHLGTSIDIATRPKWSIEGGGSGFDDITLEVSLFNDNLAAVFNNLAFIHSFVGGNLWYQDIIVQKSSSLYDVEIPGRFRYYFCTCDIEVKYVGKVRKIEGIGKNILKQYWLWDADVFNMEILNNIPDAYKLTFKFSSLIPNNYNSYFAYVINDKNDSVTVGKNIDSLYAQLFNATTAAVNSTEVAKTPNRE